MTRWVLGEFESGKRLLKAARELRAKGYRRMDLYTPYPVQGIDDALELEPSRITWLALFGGLAGAGGAYLIQWFCAAVDFPLDVGGRPLHSMPAFIPITFESAVLGASLFIFVGLFALFGFPRLNHPVFESEAFSRRASDDSFWVSLTLEEEKEVEPAASRLKELGAQRVEVIAP